jgi:hypothetical protein
MTWWKENAEPELRQDPPEVGQALSLRGALGPASSPTFFASSLLNFHPDPTQSAVLDSDSPRLLLCSTRQWGKSTVTAIKALHFALARPHSTVLIAAPALRQSAEFLAKAASFLEILDIPRRTDGRNRRSLLLPNNARLVAIPANQVTTRGFSPDLLLFDEAAFVPDTVIHALLPSLAATQGHLWLLSTPNGQFGFFYEAWHQKDPSDPWTRFHVKATDCPRISEDFLAEQRILLGEHQFKSEYLCEFTAGPGQLFPRELFDRCVDPNLKAWEFDLP